MSTGEQTDPHSDGTTADQASGRGEGQGPHDNSEELNALESEAFRLDPGADQQASGEASGEGESAPDTTETLHMVVSPMFAILAPAWEVSDSECHELAKAWAPVADKYLGGVDLGVEMNAVLVTALIVGPRLNQARKPQQQPEAEPNNSDSLNLDTLDQAAQPSQAA